MQSYHQSGSTTTAAPNPVIAAANAYITRFGWGSHGKMLGISRMFQDADVSVLRAGKCVLAMRPRGILSGFLAIVPGGGGIVFIPPSTGKAQPYTVRLRVSDALHQEGAVFSCYSDGVDLILEDILVWKGKPVFQTLTFSDRWAFMGEFLDEFQADDGLQGFCLRIAEYSPLEIMVSSTATLELEERQVIEIVPNAPNMKRLVWVPPAEDTAKTQTWIARRETLVGPDIFSLWSEDGVKQPNIALVRTLAISRKLREYPAQEFVVSTIWNKLFTRWEIVGIPGATKATAEPSASQNVGA
jgi:hypothetical protein